MSKSEKKPEKKPTQKAENKSIKISDVDLEQLNKEREIVKKIQAKNERAIENENQKDYEEILYFIKTSTVNNHIDMECYENLHFTNRHEYLIAKATFFICVPQNIISGITNPPSVDELKKSIERLVVFLYRESNLKENKYRIDLEIINQIVKDFEVVKILI